jgi:pSer/pThr/pTyr-binding forkhead associated (FHA) protein
MVQLKFLSGKMAGTSLNARRFPVRVGRAAKADIRVEEPGVWEEHLQINHLRAEGFELVAAPNAIVSVNQQPVQRVLLKPGDNIEIGSIRVQFWLSETRQKSSVFRERLTWTGIGLICLAQVALVYLLLR